MNLKVGDKVRTSSGVEGEIIEVRERTEYDIVIRGTSRIAEHTSPQFKGGVWTIVTSAIDVEQIETLTVPPLHPTPVE